MKYTTTPMVKKCSCKFTAYSVGLALVVGVVAVPVTMTGLFRSIDDDGYLFEGGMDQRTRAIEDRVRLRSRQRRYFSAVEVYRDLIRKGAEGLEAPDVNDVDSIEFYLDPKNLESLDGATHGSAHKTVTESAEVESVKYEDLDDWDRDTLDGYIATGFCPESIKTTHKHVPGYFDLCLEKLEEQALMARDTFYNRAARLKGFKQGRTSVYQSLKQRLSVLKESLGGMTLRPKHEGRPSTRLEDAPTVSE